MLYKFLLACKTKFCFLELSRFIFWIFSICSGWIHRCRTCQYGGPTVLTLNPGTLLNSIIGSIFFFLDSLGLYTYTITSFLNKGSFIYSFSICMTPISFASLIGLAKTFTTVLTRSGKSRHLLFCTWFLGTKIQHLLLRMILTLSFSRSPFITLGKFLSNPGLLMAFIINVFYQMLIEIIEIIICFFSFNLLTWWIGLG